MRLQCALYLQCFSWRDLNKFSTIFDMPQPLADMPSRYLNKIENTVQLACQSSIKAVGEELHMKIDTIPSYVLNCINIAVCFYSSWKTRGFYSNLGFGSAISATTKKVVDYVLLNRICEKCNRFNEMRTQENPEEYKLWFDSHRPNCKKNFSGSSQSMEYEAAKIIWSRSISKHQLCLHIYRRWGLQILSTCRYHDPYPLVPIHKEEFLEHVSKRVKKSLFRIKKNTKNKSYVRHKLPEPKAEYIASNYSTVVLQHRGKSPAQMATGLNILFLDASGDHTSCEVDSWCRWRQTSTTHKPPPGTTNYTSKDILEVREVFNNFATKDFCKHLTLGMTQNANESLHNTIWNFCPKAKYISQQSVRISTGIAVTIFNEGELSLNGILSDLNLNPSFSSFRSLSRRQLKRKQHLATTKKNIDRRTRRQRTTKERRESGDGVISLVFLDQKWS